MDDANVGMIQGGRRFCFLEEPRAFCLLLKHMRGEKLQGDKPVQLHILALVDDTHAALAQFLDDFVVPYRCADHDE